MGNGKARRITFDLETYRTRNAAVVKRVAEEAIAKRPAQNQPKAVKETWDTERAMTLRGVEALAKTAVDVLLAEVLCCCTSEDYGDGGGPTEQQFEAMSGDMTEDEALDVLAAYWRLAAGPQTIWCGHNILGFDLPVLLNRWRHHRIQPPEWFPSYNAGRWYGRVYDTMRRVPCANGLGYVSLSAVCESYGLPEAKSVAWRGQPLTGEFVGEAYEAGDWQTILEYCSADVRAVDELYQVMTMGGAWGTYDVRSDVAEQVAEIEGSPELTEGARAIAVYQVLDAAGLIPRAVRVG